MKPTGSIKLSEEVIIHETAITGNSFELPLPEVKAIFKYQNQEDAQGYILVNEKHLRKYVPVETEGLASFIDAIAEKLKIPSVNFEFNQTDKTKGASNIYLKRGKRNYQLLPDTYVKDQTEGYEIIGAKSTFCKWGTTIDELEKLGVLEILPVGTSGQKISIAYPVRIGRILIDGLEIMSGRQRRDYPVKTFHARVTNAENTENSFYETYACLKQGAKKNSKQSESITKNRMYIEMSITDIVYKLSYMFSSPHDLELGYSSLFIENTRVYYDRLQTFDEFSTINPTTCHYFKAEVNIYNQLSNNKLIGVTPKGLFNNENLKATIWADQDAAIIGFSQREYSYIFELNEIESFTIANIRPARGRGGASLNVIFATDKEVDKSWVIFEGKYQSFDKSVAILEAMSGKPVRIAPEWADD